MNKLVRGAAWPDRMLSPDRVYRCLVRIDVAGIRALIDSASVVQMIVRISWSKAGNGTNSAQALVHSRTIAG